MGYCRSARAITEVVSCAWDGGHVWPESEEHGAFGNRVLWQFFGRNVMERGAA